MKLAVKSTSSVSAYRRVHKILVKEITMVNLNKDLSSFLKGFLAALLGIPKQIFSPFSVLCSHFNQVRYPLAKLVSLRAVCSVLNQ